MPQLALIGLATVVYAAFQIAVSRMAGRIDPNLGASIYNTVGLSVPFLLYIFLKLKKTTNLLPVSKEGIISSLIAGVFIALFSILLVKVFEKGNLSYTMPLIYGGSIAITSLIGFFFFKDQVTAWGIIGLVLVSIGIGCIIFSKV